MTFIRPPAVAGTFYPGTARELESAVQDFFAIANEDSRLPVRTCAPKAVVVPHAGYVYSGALAARVFARLQPAIRQINRVVLLGPCHRVPLHGLALSGADAFKTPLGDIPVDKAGAEIISALPQVQVFEETHTQEHSLEVQLPFLQMVLGSFSVLPLVVGSATSDEIAEVLEMLWGGSETLIVISSDLSHYLDYDSARKIDSLTCKAIENLDPHAIGDSQACGRIPLKGLLTLAKRKAMQVETIGLCNSGDTAGPQDRVVGYGGWAFYEHEIKQNDFEERTRKLLDQHGSDLLTSATSSVLHGLSHGAVLPVNSKDYASPLVHDGACFVTLKHGTRLRGCIGSPEAYRPLIVDTVENAYSAAFHDPRFEALTHDELNGLDLSISVLSPPVDMTFESEDDLLGQLRPGVDGLIIQDHGKRALFLPSVWEQLPDPRQFLDHLKNKAGLAGDHWSATFAARHFIAGEIATADHGGANAFWN